MIRKVMVIGLSFALSITSAYASEGAHEAHALPPFGEFASELMLYWINFLVFLGIMIFALRKPLQNAWGQRREKTAQQVNSAKQALIDSEQALSEAQKNSVGLKSRLEQIAKDIKSETALECEQIVADAKQKAQRIAKQANDSIAAEQKAAERAVQRELIQLALIQSEAKLEQEINAQSDKNYRSAVLQNVKSLVQ